MYFCLFLILWENNNVNTLTVGTATISVKKKVRRRKHNNPDFVVLERDIPLMYSCIVGILFVL